MTKIAMPSGPVDLSVLIPMIKKIIPTTIAADLVGVQPMTGPVGEIFSMRAIWNVWCPPWLQRTVLFDEIQQYLVESVILLNDKQSFYVDHAFTREYFHQDKQRVYEIIDIVPDDFIRIKETDQTKKDGSLKMVHVEWKDIDWNAFHIEPVQQELSL